MKINTKHLEAEEFVGPLKWRVVEDGETTDFVLESPYSTPNGNSWRDIDPTNYEPPKVEYRLSKAMTDPALFNKFARLGTSREVLDFANKYGPLGVGYGQALGDNPRFDERFSDWCNAIQKMRDAIALWEALRVAPPDINFLEKRIIPMQGMGNTAYLGPNRELPYTLGDVLTWPDSPELVERGFLCLAQMVGDSIHARVVPKPVVEFHKGRPRLELRQVAVSLMGTLWLQFSQAITQNADFAQCDACGQDFIVGGRRNRRQGSRWCSDACKSRGNREKRKKEAGGSKAIS